MDLEKKSCGCCNKKFEDGEILNKSGKSYYHNYIEYSEHPLAMPCGPQKSPERIKIFYKGKLYNLNKDLKEIVYERCKIEYIRDGKSSLIGQKAIGDLSFLDSLESY
jgi:hypothetical protein